MMEMPKPGAAHRRLDKLAGTWIGDEKMHPSPFDPQGGAAAGRVENRVAVDGFALVQDYEQTRGGKVSFRGHGVFSFDGATEAYQLHWWDSTGMGTAHYTGNFDGDVLTLTSRNPMGHSRSTFDIGDGSYGFKMEFSPDGQNWMVFMEGSYKRQE